MRNSENLIPSTPSAVPFEELRTLHPEPNAMKQTDFAWLGMGGPRISTFARGMISTRLKARRGTESDKHAYSVQGQDSRFER